MAGLHPLAELLSDYAISIAKRHRSAVVEDLHLLAAIRRWDEESFDQRFPSTGALIRSALVESIGTAIEPPTTADNVATRLRSIEGPADAWTAADALAAVLSARGMPATGQRSGVTRVLAPTPVDPSASGLSDPLPFPLTTTLVDRVASALGCTAEEAAQRVLREAHAICVTVIGRKIPTLASTLAAEAGFPNIKIRAVTRRTQLVRDVVLGDRAGAGRVAAQLAVALVEIAEWAAAIDDAVTAEETDRIDLIRLDLRRHLGDRIEVPSPALDRFEERFSGLVGLDSVKAELRRRIDFLVVTVRRRKRGMPVPPQRMHMAFTGNPGTGKTTVARIFGELLHELGLLPTARFIETDRSGLIGQHVGETEKRTVEVINSADGGVLFIDEAYALNDQYSNDHKGYGEEALDVLVKQMEDRRERLMVIIAGYTAPMLALMSVNPGLKSRVPVVLEFPDYTVDELQQIAGAVARRLGLTIQPDALERIVAATVADRGKEGFGNARSVENLIEAAQRAAAGRVARLGILATESELNTITADDVPNVSPTVQRRIGFARGV